MRLCGLLRRVEIGNIRKDVGEDALRDWSIGYLKYTDRPFCGVGHDIAVNDLAPQPVRAHVVPDFGDDDGAVHGADRRQDRSGHHRKGLHVELEQFANGNRAAVALGLGDWTDECAELAASPMISAGEMRALAVED